MEGHPAIRGVVQDRDDVLVIECHQCVMRATSACHDCVVTFLCDDERHDAQGAPLLLDADEQRVVHLFAKAGLVPTLRHRAAV
jgi:hypothetical protein